VGIFRVGLGRRVRATAGLAAVGALALTGVAVAATSGTYTGTSKISLDGTTATHAFSVTVRSGRIVALGLIASGTCGTLEATTSKPLAVKVPISHDRFDSTVTLTRGDLSGDKLTLVGRFNPSTVTGSFSGKLVESATHSHCAIPKQSFRATR
jgi:hypothetical protein